MKSLIMSAAVVLAAFTSCQSGNTEQAGTDATSTPQDATQSKQISADLNVDEFEKGIQGEDVIILDVRTPDEYAQGHIANAKLMNIYDGDFNEQLKTLDAKKPVYVYCRSGGRSGNAKNIMKQMGFSEVYNLRGGMMAWSGAGKAVAK